MANNTIVKVAVLELSKFGYKDANGYVNYSNNCTDHDKGLVVPGASFEAELYTAPSGARYLNKIVARASHVEAPKAQAAVTDFNPPVDVERAKKVIDAAQGKRPAFTPKFTKEKPVDNTMSKEDWANKDQRISRQGVIQAAVIALAPTMTVEVLFDEADKLATQMLEFVNRK
jgi:hypothetical protein